MFLVDLIQDCENLLFGLFFCDRFYLGFWQLEVIFPVRKLDRFLAHRPVLQVVLVLRSLVDDLHSQLFSVAEGTEIVQLIDYELDKLVQFVEFLLWRRRINR